MMNIIPLCALNDNYIWMIIHPDSSTCIVVDPGAAEPVLSTLRKKKLNLAGILITHHHWDHTQGIAEILAEYPTIPVFGPATESIPYRTHPLKQDDTVKIEGFHLDFQIIDIPGHTSGHIAYYGHKTLFCGDTLFTAGCGRLFEGTAEQMLGSLQKLAALPDDTWIYCGHEYTEANLHFAKQVEPHNQNILKRLTAAQQLRTQQRPTVPACLSLEKATNVFLRSHHPMVQKAAEGFAGKPLDNPIAVFSSIRCWKDEWVYPPTHL